MNRVAPALVLLCLRVAAAPAQTDQSATPTDGPLLPESAVASFQLEPGLKIELVAAEPAVVDPVALCFDERGRMFVAENRGYPTGPGAGQPPVGTIAMLEDRDGDGRYERRTTFAESLTFPNGVLPWKGGLFVTCAPDLLYLKDTTGDGRADERRVIFTGFATNKSTQLRVCYPTLGPDNWIYLSSGLSGGKITSPDFPNRPPIDLERNDFRFKPGTDQFEAADGKGQFGHAFDDFGHRFTCMNRVHIQHIVLPAHYLRRNPNLAFSDTMQNVPEAMINDLLKGENRAARIYPISANITTADSHAGTFTAACGLVIYRGTALPTEFQGQAFACDPTGNLVHRDELIPAGATFTSRPAREGVEFVASTDNWFRPVFLANGPDGALYICDMYRKTIEHPEYLPEEIRKKTDFEGGKGMGRIYRVSGLASASGTKTPKVDFAKAEIKDLCSALSHPNAWHRDTAQRLLVERQDRSAIPILESLIASRRTPILSSSSGRFHALRTLAELGSIHALTLECALSDPVAGVRETAIQLVEPLLQDDREASRWLDRLAAMANDPDARVRFQCALSLGEVPFRSGDEALPAGALGSERLALVNALARIGAMDSQDRWTRAAILSAITQLGPHFLGALMEQSSSSGNNVELFGELGRMLSGDPASAGSAVRLLRRPHLGFDRRAAFLARFAEGLQGGEQFRGIYSPLKLVTSAYSGDENGELLQGLFLAAQSLAGKESEPMDRRLRAVALLAQADGNQSTTALLPLLENQQTAELQTAAVRALLQPHHPGIAAELLATVKWRSCTPQVRSALLSALLSRQSSLPAVLDAIESSTISPALLTGPQRSQLLKHKDPAIRQRAEALFSAAQTGNRMAAYEESKSVLSLKPMPQNGRAVFKLHCSACHRLDREGIPVGPDLFGIRNQPKEAILLHVVAPDYEIAPGFAGYTVETKDGRTFSGLILSETRTSVTVRQAQGIEENILRSSIASLETSRSSLMPQEFEKAMSRQDLADLIAYLKGE